jgi:hypothetical protein
MPNPYATGGPVAAINLEMGRQSQQRNSLQKRTYKLAASNSFPKRKKGDQETLFGEVAFSSEKDCVVCKARSVALLVPQTRIPKRSHHPLCIKNTKTKGKGELSSLGKASLEDDKRYKALTAPIRAEERGSWKHSTREAGENFFQPWKTNKQVMSAAATTRQQATTITPERIARLVTEQLKNDDFRQKHESKEAPIAIIAFAKIVMDNIVNVNLHGLFFDGLTMTVPDAATTMDPYYHSIIGQKLLLVD